MQAAAATPALVVWLALRGAFGDRPAAVLSGVNRGRNVGRAVLHSGTVGAALTASIHGARALAVSLDVEDDEPCRWETANGVARRCVEWLLRSPRPVVLNCNVPNRPVEELAGLAVAPLAAVGAAETAVTDRRAGRVRVQVAADAPEPAPGTDTWLLRSGTATITPLRPVSEDVTVDLADLEERAPSGTGPS